jgi:hypothetical protein
VRAATDWLRRIEYALVLVGDALAIVGLFSPWYRLYTTFGDAPGEHLHGPWTVLRESADARLPALFWVFLPVAVLVASSVASLLIRATRGVLANLGDVALLLASGCLAVALGVLIITPQSLPFSWPYYTIRSVEYGAWAGVAGFACVALGILCIRAPIGANNDRPATLPG